jgi:hypothetical protein
MPKNLVRKGEAGIGMSLDQVARATPRHPPDEMPAKRVTMWVSSSTIMQCLSRSTARSSAVQTIRPDQLNAPPSSGRGG